MKVVGVATEAALAGYDCFTYHIRIFATSCGIYMCIISLLSFWLHSCSLLQHGRRRPAFTSTSLGSQLISF